MSLKLSRRHFLRGLGGAVVAVPLLGSVAERAVRRAGAAVAGPQKRLIVMFTHYGCLTDRWFPESAHGALTGADFKGLSTEPLAPFASKLLLPRGIRAMNEWNAQLIRGQGNDPHTQVVGSYFTCVPVTPNTDNPFSFETSTKFSAMPVAPSLDHVCARQLSPGGVPLFLRVAGTTDSPQSGISYSASETAYSGIGSLTEAFGKLTGLLKGGSAVNADTYQALRGKSVIDLVRDDLATLERVDMSVSDKQKLKAWKELLYETGRDVVRGEQCSAEYANSLGLTAENFALRDDVSKPDISTKLTGNSLDQADLFSNLAVLAAVCNANPVIFLKYPGNYVYKGLGLTVDSHGISHRVGNANMGGACLANVNDIIQKVDTFYAQKFAHLVGKLDSIQEGDGTVLDNSATVWFQEMSDGNAHNLNNIPIVQAGGCGGYFKTGQAVNVDGGDPKLSRGESSVACGASPLPTSSTTGTDAKFANAPINKYYCNLMNAIGVKAGADGFPAVGGSEEVVHYGMYDRTEDFVGGGKNPPRINFPGEYKELRVNT